MSAFSIIPVGHVEAGLRTWDKYSPFLEEINRQMTDRIADICFAPTRLSANNLIQGKGVETDNVFVTGNTVIDALHYTLHKDYKNRFGPNPSRTKNGTINDAPTGKSRGANGSCL